MDFEIDPVWYEQQHKLARSVRPPGTGRIRKDRERVLIGYVEGVLILVFPGFEASIVSPGRGEGWFSLNPFLLAKLLATFSKPVRVAPAAATIAFDRYQQPHDGLRLHLGHDDPELEPFLARIEEIAAEHCHRRLAAREATQERIASQLHWHRAEQAANSAPLLELIREGSLIVYRLPKAPAAAPSLRAIVDRKQITPSKVFLLCHDFRGAKITVDPRWVTHVGC